jgi:hypothetical protein
MYRFGTAASTTGGSPNPYGSKTLYYDDESRLTRIDYGDVTDTYTYNWQGLRTRAPMGQRRERKTAADGRLRRALLALLSAGS